MTKSKLFFAAAFGLVLLYAAALTVGLGPARVAEKLREVALTLVRDGRVSGDYNVLADYTEVACPAGDHLAIGHFGQSNATNTVKPLYQGLFPPNLVQYDWKSRRCYAYQEPLLGADFLNGNTLSYAAVALAESAERPVVVVPFGFGPSSVLEWGHGRGATQIALVLERLQQDGITPQAFLWHQGESDVPVDGAMPDIMATTPYFKRPTSPLRNSDTRWGLSREAYRVALGNVVAQTLDAFPDSRFGVALVSHAPCLGRSDRWEPLRDAQRDVIASEPRAFLSADSDAIAGPGDRYDSCHFSAQGARKLSAAYLDSLRAAGVIDAVTTADAAALAQ